MRLTPISICLWLYGKNARQNYEWYQKKVRIYMDEYMEVTK